MTIVVIGPLTQDQIITPNSKTSATGGASYFQSFVFEEFNIDYVVAANFNNLDLIKDFPNLANLIPIVGGDTHYFINEYPKNDNSDIRVQYSNFADIPILKSELEFVLENVSQVDAFILNPLNRFDFPIETINYLKSFNIPIYLSIQGLLRLPDEKIDDKNYSIKLEKPDNLDEILNGIEGLFLDENEAKIIFDRDDFDKYDIGEIVITNASEGSRIISDGEIKIDAVEVDNIIDSTGCGDTYMAAYILKRLLSNSPKEAGEFASLIASEKLMSFGPYKSLI
jgi:hypothetical protein